MTPSAFSLSLTVPDHPEGAAIVAAVAAHAVEYVSLDAAIGAAFVERARALALNTLIGNGQTSRAVQVAAAGGQLTVTIGARSVSQPLSA